MYDYEFTRQAATQYVGLAEDPKSGLLTNFIGPTSKSSVSKMLKGIEADYDVVTTTVSVDQAWREVFADGSLSPRHRWFSRLPEKQRKELELFYVALEAKIEGQRRESAESNQFAEVLKKDWAHVDYRYKDGHGEGKAKLPHMLVSFADSGNDSAVVMRLEFTSTGGIFKTNRATEAAKILSKVSELLSKISM